MNRESSKRCSSKRTSRRPFSLIGVETILFLTYTSFLVFFLRSSCENTLCLELHAVLRALGAFQASKEMGKADYESHEFEAIGSSLQYSAPEDWFKRDRETTAMTTEDAFSKQYNKYLLQLVQHELLHVLHEQLS